MAKDHTNKKQDTIIAIVSQKYPRQHAAPLVERLIQTCDALRSRGLVNLASQLESSYFSAYENDGINIELPIVMELRNVTEDIQIWQYSDIGGFCCSGLKIPGLSTPVSAEYRAQVIAINSCR